MLVVYQTTQVVETRATFNKQLYSQVQLLACFGNNSCYNNKIVIIVKRIKENLYSLYSQTVALLLSLRTPNYKKTTVWLARW